MRRLIINADDLGCNPQRSHGIFQCMEFGVVTSATIWPNTTHSATAARHAVERGYAVGLHLNLVEEYPISKKEDVSSLVQSNGMFFDVKKLFGLLDSGAVLKEHLEREIRAQVEWCFDQGLTPTHIAGNWDAHIHPQIANILGTIMGRYGIRFVRIPCEEPLPPFGFEVPDKQLEEIRVINDLSKKAREIYAANDIGSTDYFRGHTLLGNSTIKNLRHILNKLPEGTIELMVHPGSAITYGTNFDLDPQRQTELRMLLDESIPQMIKEKKVELISWNDL